MIVVIENQTLFDIAIQEDGSALSAFDWAVSNNLSITDILKPGQKLTHPVSKYRNVEVVNYFKDKNQFIATAPQPTDDEIEFLYEFALSF